MIVAAYPNTPAGRAICAARNAGKWGRRRTVDYAKRHGIDLLMLTVAERFERMRAIRRRQQQLAAPIARVSL